MRKLFSGYYRPNDEEFSKLWSEAIFIFDTNVLLNLYSYPEEVRDVFLSVLSKLESRLWVPYQVGLEFHRNRFARIKQSNQRVEKLLKTIRETGDQFRTEVNSIELEKRNIGILNIQERLTAVQEAHKALSEAVQLACDKLPPISLDDPIGEKICKLLEGRVGMPPKDQADLDLLLCDAQERFDKLIPPGFADIPNKGDGTLRDREITYPRKFGDLILWRQIFSEATEKKITAIVFVTGDMKKDWWLFDDNKTLGPLPELVQEITLKTPVDLFWMYSADQFLKNAETHLKATEVTPETIEQVKELSSQNQDLANTLLNFSNIMEKARNSDKNQEAFEKLDWMSQMSIGASTNQDYLDQFERMNQIAMNASLKGNPSIISHHPTRNRLADLAFRNFESVESAVYNWLVRNNPTYKVIENRGFPDFIIDKDGALSGYEVRTLRTFSPRAIQPQVINALLRGYVEVNEGRLQDFSIILVLPQEEINNDSEFNWEDVALRAKNLLQKYPAHSIILGVILSGIFKLVMTIDE
jgi:PIN like domain